MTLADIRELAAGSLPEDYEHLELTFYGQKSRLVEDRVIIGDDCTTDLCVRLSEGGVYSIDPEEKLPTRFVNSSIPQLASCLEVSKSFSQTTNTDAEILSRQMREALTRIDPQAFANAENWWAVILEQLACGL